MKTLETVVALFLSAGLASAQVTAASIAGVVRDSSDRVVSGAKIGVHRIETDAIRNATTDQEGRYVASDLELGTYEVTAERNGFKSEVRSGIELTVGRAAEVNFTLSPGEVHEKVIVTGDAPLVETSTSAVGETMERQEIAALPLNGRNYTQLALLLPGVVGVPTVGANPFFGLTQRIATAGARASSGGVYLLDGTNIMSFFNDNTGNPALGTALGVDAIQEFKVETNGFSPEYGRAGASVINAISRSGSNALHGAVFEYLRNSALDARNFFDNPSKPAFRRNQFGATIGGPIAKDKTFFFANYEGLRENLGETEVGGSPTLAARQGTANPAIVPLLNLLPLPNGPNLGGGIGELITTGNRAIHEDFASARIDHYLSPRDSIFARFMFDDGELNDPYPLPGAYLPNFNQLSQGQSRFATVQETKIVSARTVNSARVSFNRSKSTGDSPDDPAALNFVPGEVGRAAGDVVIGGVGYIGANPIVPYHLILNTWTFADDVTMVRGRHVFKAGFEWEKIQNPYRADLYAGGSLTFNTLSDFLSGSPATFVAPLPGKLDTSRTWNENVGGGYIYDSWRVRPTLTLNLGLRDEFITNPTESHGRFASLSGFRATSVTSFPHVFASNPSTKNIAPRVGFAWDVTGDGKTSVRGGFGLFFQEYMPRDYAEYGFNPPETVLGVGISPGFPISAAALFALPPSIQLVTGYNIAKSPYLLEYNLNVQREVAPGLLVEVGGLFSGGRHLLGAYDYNQPLPNGTAPDGRPTRSAGDPRSNPDFSALDFIFPIDNSFYAALVARVEKRLSRGGRAIASYTWSHSLDTQSNEFNGDGWNDSTDTTDINNLNLDHASSVFDIRQNLTITYVYDLPFARAGHGLRKTILSGWQVSGIGTFHTGLPFSIENGFDRANTLGSFAPPQASDRPDAAPGFSGNAVLGSPNQWFNPAAFVLQPAGAFGDLGRNTLRGPALANIDCGFFRTFRATERIGVQFRFEAFNILNHANFAVPSFTNRQVFLDASGTVNPQAGEITQTVTSSRQLQFAIRLGF